MNKALWDELAQDLGFEDLEESLVYLYKEWSFEAIGDLFGVAGNTIRHQYLKLGLVPRKKEFRTACMKACRLGIGEIKRQGIKRRYEMCDGNVSWAKLGRQFNVNDCTAKRYALGIDRSKIKRTGG